MTSRQARIAVTGPKRLGLAGVEFRRGFVDLPVVLREPR